MKRILLALLILVALGCPAHAQPMWSLAQSVASTSTTSPSSLLTGLVAYWTLDEVSGVSRIDSTGRSNTLTDVNANVAQTATAVQGSAALFLSAQSRYLSIADNADTSLAGGDWTVAGWAQGYPTLAPNGGQVMKYGNNGEREWLIAADGSKFYATASTDGSNPAVTINSSVAVAADTWYFVALRYSGTDLSLRVNATSGTSSFAAGIFDGTGPLEMGGSYVGVWSNTTMDEWGVWKRALTDTELDTLYNGGLGIAYPF